MDKLKISESLQKYSPLIKFLVENMGKRIVLVFDKIEGNLVNLYEASSFTPCEVGQDHFSIKGREISDTLSSINLYDMGAKNQIELEFQKNLQIKEQFSSNLFGYILYYQI